ncbi:MAG TPA: hypothetical protein VGV89_05895 [Thermoplasmata archaeon]|nr:hypothetical protein [Thermoplasmata archaeon]
MTTEKGKTTSTQAVVEPSGMPAQEGQAFMLDLALPVMSPLVFTQVVLVPPVLPQLA